ncbi:MAG: hypothetical protein ACKVOO_04820 [Burkholderiaceae bacterium]
MNQPFLKAICLAFAMLLGPALAQAGNAEVSAAAPASSAASSSKKPGGKKANQAKAAPVKAAVIPGGSGETAAAREKRLKRECKGRPDAGACLGFGS